VNLILIKYAGGFELEGDSNRFILTSNGSYFLFSQNTKYRGLHFLEKKGDDWTLIKAIDDICFEVIDTSFEHGLSSFTRHTKTGYIKYFFWDGCLIVEPSIKGRVSFTLDIREIYDFDDKGRIYSVTEEKGCILVEYSKYSDSMLENIHYTRFLAIKTDIAGFEKSSQWREISYQEDIERNSYPNKLYVHDAFSIKCNRPGRIAIAFSPDKEAAIAAAKNAFDKAEEKNEFTRCEPAAFAYRCALQSVEDLFVRLENTQGYYAGLPWFFQFWTRDEAISLKPVDKTRAKNILLERISQVGDDGRIPNRFPYSSLATADGTGWVFFRAYELAQDNVFDNDELLSIYGQLEKSIDRHQANYIEDMLISNKANETWMDTSRENDKRDGPRIEIQALWLSMLDFADHLQKTLNKEQRYKKLKEDTLTKAREAFFNNGLLHDGKADPTIRPNIFLACYIYRGLLSNEEWEKVFDNSLPHLWLEWGGLATIDKGSALFCPDYTGENNISYHRGDSWFFLNNIAALCLQKTNKDKYKEYIQKIVHASTTDILQKGIIGRPSEISSASSQKAEASLFQLWSAATYIELAEALDPGFTHRNSRFS
jgi:glycogen debranching enzyme